MTRNVFHRDFTLCKAAALVGLMGAAQMLGGVPKADSGMVDALEAESVRLIPANLTVPDLAHDLVCDPEAVGIDI